MNIADELDLRGVECPTNSARALLRLETMDKGDILAVTLDPGEPVLNVPQAAKLDGHVVIAQEPVEGGIRLLIRCGAN